MREEIPYMGLGVASLTAVSGPPAALGAGVTISVLQMRKQNHKGDLFSFSFLHLKLNCSPLKKCLDLIYFNYPHIYSSGFFTEV